MKGDITKFQNLDIDATKLNEELERQSSNYVFVAQFFNEADAEYEGYKLRCKQLVAAIDERVRLDALKENKKTTEAAIQKEIERHPDYIKAMEHQIALYRRKEDLKALMQGWRDRKDMLIQRAINERSEAEQIANATVRKIAAVG